MMSKEPEIDHKAVLETLKYTTADGFKRLQTALTKTANSIERDAVKGRLNTLFTYEEKQTLEQAAALLRQVKSRVEHAKEIKAREEKRREKVRQAMEQKRRKIAQKHLPTDPRELITLNLYLSLHQRKYGAFGFYCSIYDEPEFIEQRILDESRSFTEIANIITGDVKEWLVTQGVLSAFSEDEPDEGILLTILDDCQANRKLLESRFALVFDAMDRREAMASAPNVTRLNPRPRRQR